LLVKFKLHKIMSFPTPADKFVSIGERAVGSSAIEQLEGEYQSLGQIELSEAIRTATNPYYDIDSYEFQPPKILVQAPEALRVFQLILGDKSLNLEGGLDQMLIDTIKSLKEHLGAKKMTIQNHLQKNSYQLKNVLRVQAVQLFNNYFLILLIGG
jgi:hypothetical protein